MKESFNNWKNVNNLELNKVIDLVLTNGTLDTIYPDKHIFNLFENTDKLLKVLDFGCGICRNAGYLATKYPKWTVVGYDNENMLNHATGFCKQKYNFDICDQYNLLLTSDWDCLKSQKFDVIFAVLVFQHIHEKDIEIYLKDIAQMTKKLIVSGRQFNDDMVDGNYKNTWQIVENCGLYPTNVNLSDYKTSGGPHEHITCIYDFK